MPYVAPTLAVFRTGVAARLQDPTNVFWTSAELTLYIAEALRTWNIMAAWYRDRMVFNTTANESFYDLATVPNSLIPRTVTVRDLFQAIQYSLLEPPTLSGWTGSEQFTAEEIVSAIQNTRDQFLLETGCVLTHTPNVTGSMLTGRFDLDPSTIDVRRAVYLDANGGYTLLWRSDEYELNAWVQDWNINPDTPSVYSLIATLPVRFQIAPLPNIPGVLDLVTVNSGVALDPAVPTILGVPDDLAWVVKFGALADLLSKDGPASDPARAAYCEKRYQLGVELARLTATVLFAQIDGLNAHVCSLFDMDTNMLNWQGDAPAAPSVLGMAGMNMLAVAPTPDAGPHSITLDVLRNFPIPVMDGDIIQVGQEELDVITDYVEHLAAFKMAGAEFAATQSSYDKMVRLAYGQNARWRAFSKAPGDDTNRNRRDFSQVRRAAHPEPMAVASDMDGGI